MCTCPQFLGQSYADDSVLQVGGMQFKLSVTIENLTDVRQFIKVVFHTFDGHHRLFVLIDGHCLIFHTLGHNVYFGQLADLREYRVVRRSILSYGRNHLKLGVELCEKRCDEIMEAVEYAQHDDQRHCCHSYSHH